MTDIVDRIKQLLREHQFRVDLESSSQPMCCLCQEGRTDLLGHMLRMEPLQHLDHLAAVIVAELGDPWEERANDEKRDWMNND